MIRVRIQTLCVFVSKECERRIVLVQEDQIATSAGGVFQSTYDTVWEAISCPSEYKFCT